MLGIQNFWIFLLAGITLNLTPGQDTLYIIGRSIAQGRQAGIMSVFGISTGGLIHAIAAAIGLYSVLALSPIAFTAICGAGALYLVYLGIMTGVRGNSLTPAYVPGDSFTDPWVIYRQGILTNVLNPKVALFFLAFLPQFIDPVSNLGSLSFLILGCTFVCTGTVWCLVVALCASGFADVLKTRPDIQRGCNYVSCLLFIGLGISILLSHL